MLGFTHQLLKLITLHFILKKLTYIKIIKDQKLFGTALSYNNFPYYHNCPFNPQICKVYFLMQLNARQNMKKKLDNYYKGYSSKFYETFTSENQKGKFLFHTIFFLIKSKLKGAET